jgi:hypothetical protein
MGSSRNRGETNGKVSKDKSPTPKVKATRSKTSRFVVRSSVRTEQ